MSQPLDPTIYAYFQRVDYDQSGYLSEEELLRATQCYQITPETTEILIAMFDKTGARQIDAYSFQEIWGYLTQWQQCYQGADCDGTGSLDIAEVLMTFCQMGYDIATPEMSAVIRKKFDMGNKGYFNFDDFVRIGVFLQSTSTSWWKFDTQRQGCAQLSFENLLEMALFSQGPVPPSQQQCMQPQQQMQPVINITIVNNNTNSNEDEDTGDATPIYDLTEESKPDFLCCYRILYADGEATPEGDPKTTKRGVKDGPDFEFTEEEFMVNKCYHAKIVTQSGKKVLGKTNLKKAWYGWGGKEYAAQKGDQVYILNKEVLKADGRNAWGVNGRVMHCGEHELNSEDSENQGLNGWFHCTVSPWMEQDHEGPLMENIRIGFTPGRFRKGEGTCYYTSSGKEYELDMCGCCPIDSPEDAYVSLESLGIEIE